MKPNFEFFICLQAAFSAINASFSGLSMQLIMRSIVRITFVAWRWSKMFVRSFSLFWPSRGPSGNSLRIHSKKCRNSGVCLNKLSFTIVLTIVCTVQYSCVLFYCEISCMIWNLPSWKSMIFNWCNISLELYVLRILRVCELKVPFLHWKCFFLLCYSIQSRHF